MFEHRLRRRTLASAAAIVLVSASLGVFADWQAPGLNRYAADWLMRARGSLPVPAEIAIVAIDEPSIAAFGRFPWPRQVLAKTIDALSRCEPKVIAIDVLFADPTTPLDDGLLADSAARAGNVVLAAQLVDGPQGSAWLMPLPAFAQAAAGIGHVNVQVESDGVARAIAAETASDSAQPLRAMALESVRVAERVAPASVRFTGPSVVIGRRVIPLDTTLPSVTLAAQGSVTRLPAGRIAIDYIGPAGSFAPATYSLADVVQNKLPAATLRGRYVLVGATAASLGDRLASPFVHQADSTGDQHGVLMPGVEVLANSLNTILRERFYTETGDGAAFAWAGVFAALALFAFRRSEGARELLRHALAFALLIAAVLAASYLAFTRLLLVPPLVPSLIALAAAAILELLWRSLAANSHLDRGIVELSQSTAILPAPLDRREPATNGWLPHGLEWKAQRLRELNRSLIERAQFVDLALRSVEDGLIIATADGAIAFANRGAGDMLHAPPAALVGQNLLQRLEMAEGDLLHRLTVDRSRIEREIELLDGRPRRYILRMAAVAAGRQPDEPVYGIVASLSDITRQHELQQTKNDVIALVSHEMRTPLTAIQGMTELLATYEIDAPRRKEISTAINGEVKRLASMISEYLDITRLESGKAAIARSPVRLETLLPRMVLLLEPVAAQKNIHLSVSAESSLPPLFADPELLGRAITNLVSNAIKYSPPGAAVTVSAVREANVLAISVSDTGYGIPEEDLARIFEKFYRVPRVEDAGVPGTGLGLAMVREIAQFHGGIVTVTSKINHGSTFCLRFPVAGQVETDVDYNENSLPRRDAGNGTTTENSDRRR